MKMHYSEPNYGPSHLDLNLEVELGAGVYLDAFLQTCFFLPCEKLLNSLISSLRLLKEKEENILGIPPHGPGRQTLLKN